MFMRIVLAVGLAAGSVLLHPSTSAHALQPCQTNCAVLEVSDATVPLSGGAAPVVVSFQQAPTPVPPVMQGPDDIAALAFTIGIPGDGSSNPLVVACEDGRLASGVVQVPSALSEFNVVVENESCGGRDRCLCPEGDQQRDDFINFVVYGPRDLQEGGPIEIDEIPSGTLFTLNLRAGTGVSDGDTVPLHVYCEQDEGAPAKPQFAAFLSMGDQSAIDQTGDRGAADRSRVTCNSGVATIEDIPVGTCVGDCNGNGVVAINELITGVNIALGNALVTACPSFDVNNNGQVGINELIQGVNYALNGCPD